MLEVLALSKHFPGVQALTDVNISVRAGEVHGLVGQNGAGKSTLVKCITGVHRPDAGTITFGGERVTTYNPKHAADIGISVVHQRSRLLPWLSVAENVHLGRMPARLGLVVDRNEANERTRALLARFKLDIDPRVPVGLLSAAERQEVAIGQALLRDARLLVLDEPTAALDADQSQRFFRVVRNLKSEGVTVLYVSHYLEEIFELADRVSVLRDGRLVSTKRTTGTSHDELVALMAGRRPAVGADAGPDPGMHRGQPPGERREAAALDLDGVDTDVLTDVHLSVREGEVVGVTGVVGAGGHEIAQVLFGLVPLRSGEIRLGGRRYPPRDPRRSLEQGLCLVPEDPASDGLVPMLSVASNISLVDLGSFSRFGKLSLRRERRAAHGFVEELSIATASVDTPVRNLSGGNQQKVLLARALAARANVLVLEEPTQGVDVHAKGEIHKLIRSLAAAGKAALVISTDVRDLLEFVDRVVALRRGRVVANVAAGDTSYAAILDVTSGGSAPDAA